jgi:hypothetical protein
MRDYYRYWPVACFTYNNAARACSHHPDTYNHLQNFHTLPIANLVFDMSSSNGMLDLFDRSSSNSPPTATPKATFRREFGMESDKPHAAEGSLDNIHLGQAKTSYARAVAPKRRPPKRPDPEDLFDMLLARRSQPVNHPAKISSLLLGLAGIVVHDLFRTGEHEDQVASESSHLALTPLYGRSQEAQDSVRTKVMAN